MKELEYISEYQLGRSLCYADGKYWEVSTVSLRDAPSFVKSIDGIMGGLVGKAEEGDYETMVFPSNKKGEALSRSDHYLKRYQDKEGAIQGHAKICSKIEQGKLTPKKRNVSKEGW